MKKYIYTLFCIITIIQNISATNDGQKKTDADIVGHVIEKSTGEHLPFVTVILKGTTIGTTTDATGHYFLKDLPEGNFVLETRFVGYKTESYNISVKKGTTLEVNFGLEESRITLDEVVVSSNRNETTRRFAPVVVSILDAKLLEKTNSSTLAEGLNFQPGLRVENNCQNCGLTQVRINGLDGAYSQILIDSRPIFSSLSGVYGLEQIPANMVDRIEIVRGGGSAMFGSSAIAGTINIITKEPERNSAQISHSIMGIGGLNTFDNNTNLNASLVSDNNKMGIMLFGQKRNRSAFDYNGDGFSEIPYLNSRTLGFRSYIKTGLYSKITFEYHNTREFRRGGDSLDKPPFQAYIAEQVESFIDGGSIKYDMFSADSKHRFSIFSAGMLTKRGSYYGGGNPVGIVTGNETSEELENINNRLNSYGKTKYQTLSAGGQYSLNMNNFLFMPAEFTSGLEYTYDDLTDHSGYRTEAIDQEVNIKSLFAQNEWKDGRWGFLIGGRLDKHNLLKNAVISPRANIRYNPTPDVNLRLSYGKGFRAPQLFDENLHVEIAGGSYIISRLNPDLKEEKSHSFSGSVDWYITKSRYQINFLVEGFYTKLLDPFTTVSEDQPNGSIIKTVINTSGAQVYGVNLEARAAFGYLFQLQMGVTFQKSRYDEAIEWAENVGFEKRMMRTPDIYGFFVATLTPVKRFSASFSGTYTGNMLVPHEGKNQTIKTPSFFDLSWKANYEIPLYKGTTFDLNIGVQNIFNSYQDDFDKGPDRASGYVYGPALPRSYFVGAKLVF